MAGTEIPNCSKEQIEVARIISRELKTPFISVDTYASSNGTVVGEVTPTPGGSYYGMWRFQRWFDLELGDAWTEAAKELDDSQTKIQYRRSPYENVSLTVKAMESPGATLMAEQSS